MPKFHGPRASFIKTYLFLYTEGDDAEVADAQRVVQVTDHAHREAVGGGQVSQLHQGGHSRNDRVLDRVVVKDQRYFLTDPTIRVILQVHEEELSGVILL